MRKLTDKLFIRRSQVRLPMRDIYVSNLDSARIKSLLLAISDAKPKYDEKNFTYTAIFRLEHSGIWSKRADQDC
jgi:hypothetical protein